MKNSLVQRSALSATLLLCVPLTALADAGQSHALPGAKSNSHPTPLELSGDASTPFLEQEPTGALTLRDAVAVALQRNPNLAAFAWEVRARDARAVQAGLRPNPQLLFELENTGGAGGRESFQQIEATVWLSQLIELADKRGKRRQLADLRGKLAEWDYERHRLAILTETTKAFVAILAAQERVKLAGELERLAIDAVASAKTQVKAGAAPPAERTRAEVALFDAELQRKRTERDLAEKRLALAATWGSDRALFSEIRGNLVTDIVSPPPFSELEPRVEANPDLARWATELAERDATISLERARAVPDPTVFLGGRHFLSNGDSAAVFAFSVPLPIFDRNQGNVLAARHDRAKAQAEKSSTEVAVRSALARRYQALAAAFEQAQILRQRTLPAADAAYHDTRDGYRSGLFRYLDVLDAQRTLFYLRALQLDVLLAYHQARADIERLTGTPLENPNATRGQE